MRLKLVNDSTHGKEFFEGDRSPCSIYPVCRRCCVSYHNTRSRGLRLGRCIEEGVYMPRTAVACFPHKLVEWKLGRKLLKIVMSW